MQLKLLLVGLLSPSLTQAQARWQQLPGAASSYRVDLHSLTASNGILRARIQTPDAGSIVLVQEIEVRCQTEETRTLARSSYDKDTGRPVPTAGGQEADTLWISYPPGSEGDAILAGLCALGRERKVLGNAAAAGGRWTFYSESHGSAS
jgi:hypothetical protein